MRYLLGLVLFGAVLIPESEGRSLIQQALETGELDRETALLYQIYAIRHPERIPERFHEKGEIAICGTPILVEALEASRQVQPENRAALKQAMARPQREEAHLSPSGRFLIYYDLSGLHAVDAEDADGNEVPDYVDQVAASIDSVWRFQIDGLGYRFPQLGGRDRYEIYISELRGELYGFASAELDGQVAARASGFLEIDNNFSESKYLEGSGTPLAARRVTLAHEFFHLVQFGYYYGADACWWQEATATWIEEAVYPDVDDYLKDLPAFFSAPERGLDRGACNDTRHYSTSIFAHFLEQRFHADVIRRSWGEFDRQNSGRAVHLHAAIPGGLDRAMAEFAMWNYFTGRRHDLEPFYREGQKYPEVRVAEVEALAKVAVEESGRVDRLASTYIRLQPALRPGGAVIRAALDPVTWDKRLILVARDSVEIRLFPGTETRVANWDLYDEIAVILAVKEMVGGGYSYAVSAEYDPQLITDEVPAATRLEQNFPNPFRVGAQEFTVFPFALSRPSRETFLSIFTAEGRLVQRLDLGARAARTYALDRWDGRNAAGERVQSGVYYYLLEADGVVEKRSMAVIREKH